MKQFDLKTLARTNTGQTLHAYIIKDIRAISKWRLRIYDHNVDVPLRVLDQMNFEQFPIFDDDETRCINAKELVAEAKSLVEIE